MLGREPHRSACFCSPNAAGILIPCRHALLFTLWVWNSGLRDCKARGLLTELSPHNPSVVFIKGTNDRVVGEHEWPFLSPELGVLPSVQSLSKTPLEHIALFVGRRPAATLSFHVPCMCSWDSQWQALSCTPAERTRSPWHRCGISKQSRRLGG